MATASASRTCTPPLPRTVRNHERWCRTTSFNSWLAKVQVPLHPRARLHRRLHIQNMPTSLATHLVRSRVLQSAKARSPAQCCRRCAPPTDVTACSIERAVYFEHWCVCLWVRACSYICVDSVWRHRRPCAAGRAEFERTRLSAALHPLSCLRAVDRDPVRQRRSYVHPKLERPNGYARRHNT